MGFERTAFQIEQPEQPQQPAAGPEPAQPAKWRLRAAGGYLAVIGVCFGLVAFASVGHGTSTPARGQNFEPAFFKIKSMDEKTIWAYADSELSDFQKLCAETIQLHRGSFDFKIVLKDELFKYVSPDELPADWAVLKPRYQKDAAINALLARYGGAALDLSTVMFHSLDQWWDDRMVQQKKTFKGFYYKSRAETATWFMMARREGMMRLAASEQALSSSEPSGCLARERDRELCFGHGMVSLALCKHQQQYCRCYFDETEGCALTQYARIESGFDSKAYDLDNPRKSVQSPLLGPGGRLHEEEWDPLASKAEKLESFQKFKVRFLRGGDVMPFVTIQSPGSAAMLSRRELLQNKDTFFYQWLCLAKHPDTEEGDC